MTDLCFMCDREGPDPVGSYLDEKRSTSFSNPYDRLHRTTAANPTPLRDESLSDSVNRDTAHLAESLTLRRPSRNAENPHRPSGHQPTERHLTPHLPKLFPPDPLSRRTEDPFYLLQCVPSFPERSCTSRRLLCFTREMRSSQHLYMASVNLGEVLRRSVRP